VTPLDWAIVVAYALLTLGLGFWMERRGAGKDTASYFLSGRSLPWWLAGASMAASAFSIDTPLYVANLTRSRGVAGNWEWWFMGASGILGAVVMARYWRRAGIMTDLELITLRYSGRPARFLRYFRAVFFALIVNPLGMAAVITAAIKVSGVAVPGLVDPETSVPTGRGVLLIGGLIAVTVTYSVLSGFMGVVLTDLLQFVVSIVGAVILAGAVVGRAGGLGELAAHEAVRDKLTFLPDFAGPWGWESAPARFCVFMGVLWWTFVNADGGGKYVQRLASCRDEVQAERATWFSAITFIALRSWPWILTGLAALVLLPGSSDPENDYPRLIMTLGDGVRGLVFASLLSAFMSTIDTQLNWGASYLVNDLIRPALLPERSERFYVQAGRLCAVPTLAIVVLLLWLQQLEGSAGAEGALKVTGFLRGVLMVSSGLGAIYLLRWFWSGLTAWGEIGAMAAAPLTAAVCKQAAFGLELPFAQTTLVVTAVTITVAVAVSALGPREDPDVLRAFASRVRPAGRWGAFRPEDDDRSGRGGLLLAGRFVGGNLILYGLTFLVGALLLRGWGVVAGGAAALAAGVALDRFCRGRLGREDLAVGGARPYGSG